MKYQVIKGIFENTIFTGSLDKKNNRVINSDTYGQTFPMENVDLLIEFKKFTIESQQTGFKGLKYKDTVNIVNNDLENIIFTINKGKKEYKLPMYYIDSWILAYKNNQNIEQ